MTVLSLPGHACAPPLDWRSVTWDSAVAGEVLLLSLHGKGGKGLSDTCTTS